MSKVVVNQVQPRSGVALATPVSLFPYPQVSQPFSRALLEREFLVRGPMLCAPRVKGRLHAGLLPTPTAG